VVRLGVIRAVFVIVALSLAVVPDVSIAAQATARVPPLPAAERFIHGTGLRIRLTVEKPSVAAFEDPGFRIVFENIGQRTITLNPRVYTDLYIEDEAGRPVRPFRFWLIQSIPLFLNKSDLVELTPGGTWAARVAPQHHLNHENEAGADYYASDDPTGGSRLMLRRGRYRARAVYLSAPGYPSPYPDFNDFRDVWEGRLEAAPVWFSVAAGAEAELDARDRLVNESPADRVDRPVPRRRPLFEPIRDQPLEELRRLAVARAVRIAAIHGIALLARAEGLALAKRELERRNPWDCDQAVAVLNELTGRDVRVACVVPSERAQAIAEFANAQ
jgi:hypothetical protein